MKLIDAGALVEAIHNRAFKDGDDRAIILAMIEAQPRRGYEAFEMEDALKSADYWRKKCDIYERTIIALAVKNAEKGEKHETD